jgi:hypothetical protein
VNVLGKNIHTIRRNTEILIDINKGVVLELNVEETKYMLLFGLKNKVKWDISIACRLFGNTSQFKYLGRTVTNRNFIQEGI